MIVDIKRFNKNENIKILLFGYVNAMRLNMPGIPLERVIELFKKHHGLTEDDLNTNTAISYYYRLNEQYAEIIKEK